MKKYKIKELYGKKVAVYITTQETWEVFSNNLFNMTSSFYGPHFYFINEGSYTSRSKQQVITSYSEEYLMIDETELEELNLQSDNLTLIL